LSERLATSLPIIWSGGRDGLHDGQFGYRGRRSYIDAVAVLMNRTQQEWERKKIAGAVFMDVKSAFNNVNKEHLGKRMEALELEPYLIRWIHSFMTDGQVSSYLTEKRDRHTRWTRVSPKDLQWRQSCSSPIFGGREVPGVRRLSFTDDSAWWVEGGELEVAEGLTEAAKAAIALAEANGIACDHRPEPWSNLAFPPSR
jgi:hypothetical protein